VTISILGFSSTAKVPAFYGETKFAAGAISAGDIPLRLLLVGTKTSAGSATADQDIVQVFSQTDADAYFGPGSELGIMCAGALQTAGVQIWAAPTAEAGGAAAATATITITGTWTAVGTFLYRIDGVLVTGQIAATDTISNVADSIVAAVNGNTHLPCTAAKGSGPGYVVTLTRKSKGARGNQGILFQDISQLPSGLSSAIAGGSSVTGPGVHFGSGSGLDDVTNVLALLAPDQYDRIAIAQNGSANLALWKTALNTQAGPTIGILQHVVWATNGSLSAHIALAQTTCNEPRMEGLWQLNGETIPSFTAASFAALRTATEQNDPDASYDDVVIPGVAPQSQKADWPVYGTLVSALDNSTTPIATNRTGGAYIVRAITTYSLSG
jgi:phage tail sheath gpL-like